MARMIDLATKFVESKTYVPVLTVMVDYGNAPFLWRVDAPEEAGVRAGADACERVGDGLVAAHIIARPHREVEPALNSSAGFVGSKD